jgi:uncharacterized protein YbbK (DUF523 family)
MEKIKLGISSCLLGKNVRYDGGHKLDSILKDSLGKYVEYVPVCPEVECGLGVPRKSMRLEGEPDSLRLIITETRQDVTKRMVNWAQKRVIQLEKEDIRGFIFKTDSPSCGIKKVKVFNEKNMLVDAGVGIFAQIFMKHFPSLPVQDEENLHDSGLRENFIVKLQFNETQILQAERSNICQLNYPTCEAKWDYIKKAIFRNKVR